MNTSIKSSEEFRGQVTIYLNNKHTISFPTENLVNHVEKYEMNHRDIDGSKLDHRLTSDEWLDINENFDKAIESYYVNVILKP